jgi:toxin ParE1/3/4
MADFDVRLTRGAEIDLEALLGFVKDNRSAEQANVLLDRLLAAVETLETFPRRGSVPKELDALGIREFRQILVEPYRLIYRLSSKTVFVTVIADDAGAARATAPWQLRRVTMRGCSNAYRAPRLSDGEDGCYPAHSAMSVNCARMPAVP